MICESRTNAINATNATNRTNSTVAFEENCLPTVHASISSAPYPTPRSSTPRQEEIELASIWRTGAYAGEFGDPFIADTDLEGGQIAPSLHTYASIIRSEVLAEDDVL